MMGIRRRMLARRRWVLVQYICPNEHPNTLKEVVLIERATEKDYKLIADIGNISVEEAHRESSPAEDLAHYMKTNYSYEAIKEELRNPDNIYHIVYSDGSPAGFSKVVLNAEHPNIKEKNVTKLDRIYLLKEFFGLKLGAELLKCNIELAKRNGEAGIWLFTWVGNETAVQFYLKAGFQIIGTHKFKVSETHYNNNHQMYLALG